MSYQAVAFIVICLAVITVCVILQTYLESTRPRGGCSICEGHNVDCHFCGEGKR